MKAEYIKLIEEHDKTITLLKNLLDGTKPDGERREIRERIDALLDERLRLMKARDACVT